MSKHLSSLIPVALVFLCLSVAVTGVLGSSNEIVANPGLTPTIDGVISLGEWNTADTVTFNQTKVYAMQDSFNLYIAFNVSDFIFSGGDSCHILFDVENDKSSSLQSDDKKLTVRRGDNMMEFKESAGAWFYISPPYSGWTAKVNSTSTFWQVEYNITYSKINVTAGTAKTLGVGFVSYDYDLPIPPIGTTYRWPISSDTNFDKKPNMWGNMTPNGYNWVPEFSNPLILVIAFTATILMLLYAKAHKEKDIQTIFKYTRARSVNTFYR